jgi:hypothetical protein
VGGAMNTAANMVWHQGMDWMILDAFHGFVSKYGTAKSIGLSSFPLKIALFYMYNPF